jgi:hypothetical protein
MRRYRIESHSERSQICQIVKHRKLLEDINCTGTKEGFQIVPIYQLSLELSEQALHGRAPPEISHPHQSAILP